jgi:hypothetical protein
MCLFLMLYRLVLGPTQHSIQWIPYTISQVIKQPELEADPSPPNNADVKNT